MKWTWPFGNPAREAKTAWPLAMLSEPRAASWGARDAGALIRDGYLRNAVAYRCARMVAEAAASIPLKTAHRGAGALLRRPSPETAPAGFMEAVFSELLLSGNAFVEAVRLPGERAIAALFPLRSGAVRPVTDARGWVEAWAVRGRRGEERMVRRDAEGWSPMLQVKLYHPADETMGLPPLAAARRALDLHNASADWAKSLIDNAAKPSGALVYGGGGRMPPDQFDRRKEELEAGARLVLLDAAVQCAEVSATERGLGLIWRAQGSEAVTSLSFDSRETLPWAPCHLRVRAGQASWIRRGRDIPDSWTFPEAPNGGRFAAEFDSGSGFAGRIETEEPACTVPPGTLALRVAEIGPDGRTGPWLSIGPGSPYL
ncbi:MAG: phage portal protein [Hyphomonas sp.]|uniref:phage portal protein n=1 Tax=Hyphomonas sp. TaxID=87 RepID=UPI0017B2AFF4|nr:phage portal protein [Hyphomonas sp.]MBU3920154.1 phage portal protein [Alphaproteobacteria bacterium]MBA3068906.1 phage portal protein [Hyphomonas sp.]MBU4061096.1 phage portal protein [Alphaproteobacteria bacterium]MBU4162820.1 phage portal protein [Alphaproteobacteria bacterium]MBU4568321.1 phage portal protein [Alphaproteobacteria bacterium]